MKQEAGGHATTEATRPPRVVGTIGAILMSINGMVGAGIFALPALLYEKAGAFAPWMFLIFGAVYACSVLISAQLATMFRASGGVQLYVQTAFGPMLGFQVGWVVVIAQAAGRAATLYVLTSYLAVFFPALSGPVARPLAVLALLVMLGGLTLSGMRRAVDGLVVGTVLKITPIVVLCVTAFAVGGLSFSLRPPSLGTFESVALLVFFAYSGTTSAAVVAGEVKRPQRTIPRSMLLSLAIIIVFYMIVQWAYIAAGAPASRDGTPLAAAAGVVMGQAGVVALTLAAVFSIASNSLTFFVAGPRVIFGMAERGLLPAGLAHVSPRFLTPDRAIGLFTLIVAVISLSGTFAFLAEVTVLGSLFAGFCMYAAFIRFRLRGHEAHARGMSPSWWTVVGVACAISVYAAFQAPLKAYVLVAGLLVLGSVLAVLARRGQIVQPLSRKMQKKGAITPTP